MPFNPNDFVKLAEQLSLDTNYDKIKEAALRTCLSRSYYGVFLFIRELLIINIMHGQLKQLFIKIAKSGLIHACIKEIIGKTHRFLEKTYGDLHRLRKESDYNLSTEIKEKEAKKAIIIADKIIKELPKVRITLGDPTRKKILENIIQKYYNKLISRKT